MAYERFEIEDSACKTVQAGWPGIAIPVDELEINLCKPLASI